jgi:DNA-binding NarL/FixJ family response regulator
MERRAFSRHLLEAEGLPERLPPEVDGLNNMQERAIHIAARGQTYLSPAVSGHVVAAYLQGGGGEAAATPAERLSPRQRQIAQLIAEGHTTKEIAGLLHLSEKTAETHRAQLMRALGVRELAGLVRWAIRAGLVSSEE